MTASVTRLAVRGHNQSFDHLLQSAQGGPSELWSTASKRTFDANSFDAIP